MKNPFNAKSKLLNYLGYTSVLGLFGLGAYLSSPGIKGEFHTYPDNIKNQEVLFLSEDYSKIKKKNLEKKVESFMQEKIEKKELSNNEKIAWSVYDLSSNQELININGDISLQSASMVKPFIALAFYHLQNEGKLSYSSKTKRQIEEMIQHSNNEYTNLIMARVGGPKQIQKILTENYSDIFQNTEIKEYIPKGGRTYRNKSSASDYARFLHSLWNNELPNSEELKRIMALPGKDRICYGVENLPETTTVYNKTGTTAHLVGDMGILSINPETNYIIVGIIERENRSGSTKQWKSSRSNVIRDFSELVYSEIANK